MVLVPASRSQLLVLVAVIVSENSKCPRSGTDRSPCGNVLSSEKCWSSQDGGLGRVGDRNRSRASLDYDAGEYEEELVVERPPGLDKHCPDHTLKDLYPLDKQP